MPLALRNGARTCFATLKTKNLDRQYEQAEPTPANRFSFRPADVASHYLGWPKLVELCAEPPRTG